MKIHIKALFTNHTWSILLGILFCFFLFLRFSAITERNTFGWDQSDNAWAAKNIIVNRELPLVGMQAKYNSGVYIGPLYYYFVSIFYAMTNLDPIASGIIAGVTAVFSFFTFYIITKKLFSEVVAFGAVFIYTVSLYAINFDRVQWPVNFIMPLSLILFYALYQVTQGKEKYLLLLAASLGLFFHIHFTVVFFLLIILLTLPFFPRSRMTLKYGLYASGLFLLLISPVLLAQITASSSTTSLQKMIHEYYHGIHLTRIMQLAGDAFIKFDSVLGAVSITPIKYLMIPLFIFSYLYKNYNRQRVLFSYLIILWFAIPWLVFSVYKGEISDYYFSSSLPLVYIILSYVTVRIMSFNKYIFSIPLIIFWIYYSFINISTFMNSHGSNTIAYRREQVNNAIKNHYVIKYDKGAAESYFYYVYLRRNNKTDLINKYY